jgi:hypothetical protein
MPLEVMFGVGTLALLGALVWGVVRYRDSRAAREQDDIKRRSKRWTR